MKRIFTGLIALVFLVLRQEAATNDMFEAIVAQNQGRRIMVPRRREDSPERGSEEARMHGTSGVIHYEDESQPHHTRLSGRRVTRPASFQNESSYRNIRIKLVWGQHSLSNETEWAWVQSTLMPRTAEYVHRFLKVVPVSGKLHVPRTCSHVWGDTSKCATLAEEEICGTYGAVPEADLGVAEVEDANGQLRSIPAGSGGYADTDLILYVTSKQGGPCGGSTIAYAGGCRPQHGTRGLPEHGKHAWAVA